MDNLRLKKTIFSGLTVLLIGVVLSLSAYAWFFFPLTQNTAVFTDGVTEVGVTAYRYSNVSHAFGSSIPPAGDPQKISLDFYNDNDEVAHPYFFLWGGEYTSNDQYKTIYKVVVTYGNEAEAYPTYLRLFGDFSFDFWCYGDQAGEEFDVRFMKLSYFVPTPETANQYLDTSLYTPFSAADYTSGRTLDLGTVSGNPASGQVYNITFYLLLETDLVSLNNDAVLLEDEYGLLNSGYLLELYLYCRTVPANAYPS